MNIKTFQMLFLVALASMGAITTTQSASEFVLSDKGTSLLVCILGIGASFGGLWGLLTLTFCLGNRQAF